jgi:hypothetical protein
MHLTRLGGTQFPPHIMFKVVTRGINIHYFSGEKMIAPGSQVQFIIRPQWMRSL